MSVPVNKRTQGKLEVCTKAHDLCVYTLQITKNKNVFVPEYQDALTNKIVQLAIDIHSEVWSANNVLVRSPETYYKNLWREKDGTGEETQRIDR